MESRESELYKLFKNCEYNESAYTIGTTVDTGMKIFCSIYNIESNC